jgi:hypothetical protein
MGLGGESSEVLQREQVAIDNDRETGNWRSTVQDMFV